jgi:hypothetical protein
MAEFAGYGEEVSQLWQILINTCGSLGWLALDAFIKTLLAGLWFLITYIGHL